MNSKAAFNLVLIGLLLTVVGTTSVRAQRKSARKEVKVYFYHDPGEYIDLSPVTRLVSASAPARPAIEALLKGPTAREQQDGFQGLAGDFRIGSLTIKNGTARINFVSLRRWHGWPGDTAPIRFKKAVELTLKQFPTIKNVIVSLDGDKEFARG